MTFKKSANLKTPEISLESMKVLSLTSTKNLKWDNNAHLQKALALKILIAKCKRRLKPKIIRNIKILLHNFLGLNLFYSNM